MIDIKYENGILTIIDTKNYTWCEIVVYKKDKELFDYIKRKYNLSNYFYN